MSESEEESDIPFFCEQRFHCRNLPIELDTLQVSTLSRLEWRRGNHSGTDKGFVNAAEQDMPALVGNFFFRNIVQQRSDL